MLCMFSRKPNKIHKTNKIHKNAGKFQRICQNITIKKQFFETLTESAQNCPSGSTASREAAPLRCLQPLSCTASFAQPLLAEVLFTNIYNIFYKVLFHAFLTKRQFTHFVIHIIYVPVICETIKLMRISSQFANSSTLLLEDSGKVRNKLK